MSTIPRDDLEKLYTSGKSMFEISMSLKCSVHKVSYWMDKYGIKRRSRSEATYIKLNPLGDPFKIIKLFNSDSSFLFGLGIGIYWGEGLKKSPYAIRVANTDAGVIKTFRKFLIVICGLEPRKLFYSIVCFNDSDVEKVKAYWAKELGINQEKFGKIVQIPKQGKGTYKRKSEFGVCTLSVSNPKLKTWIMNEIQKLKSSPR